MVRIVNPLAAHKDLLGRWDINCTEAYITYLGLRFRPPDGVGFLTGSL